MILLKISLLDSHFCVGPPPISASKPLSASTQNFGPNSPPVNGHKISQINPQPPSSVNLQSQVLTGAVNSNQSNNSQTHLSHAGHAMSPTYSQNNQTGVRPQTQNLPPSNSIQQNGIFPNHQPSLPPNSLNIQRPFPGMSGQQANVTSSINTNQNTISNTNTNPQFQNHNPQTATPQVNLPSPPMGSPFMTSSPTGAVSRQANPNTQANVLPPQSNMNVPRNTNSSIRQRYPNMMPPPMSSNQQSTMQANLPPMNQTSSPQQTFGQNPPTGYPPTSSLPSSTQQLSTPPGFPPAPATNQTIGGRPNHGMPPSMLATSSISQRIGGLSLSQGGEAIDLLQNRHILPTRGTKIPAPKPKLQAELWNSYNCSSDIFRCTLTKVSIIANLRFPIHRNNVFKFHFKP